MLKVTVMIFAFGTQNPSNFYVNYCAYFMGYRQDTDLLSCVIEGILLKGHLYYMHRTPIYMPPVGEPGNRKRGFKDRHFGGYAHF